MRYKCSIHDKKSLLFQGLDPENKVKYYRALAAVRCEKQAVSEECPLLTYIDIQECIDVVNQQCQNNDVGMSSVSYAIPIYVLSCDILIFINQRFFSPPYYSNTSTASIKFGCCGERSKGNYNCFKGYRFKVAETYFTRRCISLFEIV